MTRTLALGIVFGILAALFIGNVKIARIDNAREVVKAESMK